MATFDVHDPLLSSRVVHQFPLPTWLENLAVRSNGQILVTVTTAPEVYLVDPADSSKTVLLAKFPEVGGLCGVAEVEDDKFYVSGGDFELETFKNHPGTYRLWEVDLTNFERDGKAATREVLKLDKVAFPNGLERLSKSDKTLIVADCNAGALFKVDLKNSTHEKLIEVDEMKNPENPFVPIAINGLAIRDGYLYWTNTSKALFCRIKIDSEGKAAGDVEIVTQGLIGDDFAFDREGNAWVAQNPLNVVTVVKAKGGAVTVAGKIDRLEVAGVTAAEFDRRPGYEHLLYVVTNGGIGGPVNGSEVEGGKVAVIDTSLFKA